MPVIQLSRRILNTAVGIGLLALSFSAPAYAQDQEPVTIRTVTALPETMLENTGFWDFVENLKETGPWITIQYLGAGDAIGPMDQFAAVRDGAVDLVAGPDPYFVSEVPMAQAVKLSPYTPAEERENGVFDYYHEQIGKAGVELVGRVGGEAKYLFYMNTELEAPDLSGRVIRVSPAYFAAVRALGGEPVQMSPTDTYTAMERGAIDGFGWAELGMSAFGLDEVVDYEIPYTFGQTAYFVMMNPGFWQGLDDATKQAIQEAAIATEKRVPELYTKVREDDQATRREAGIKAIEWSDDQVAQYLSTIEEAWWEEAIQQAPEEAAALRKLFEKDS